MVALFACDLGVVQSNFRPMFKTVMIWLTAAAVAFPSPSAAATPEPLVLKPSSTWQVNYAEDQCRLARQFGEGEQAVLLFMDRYGPSEYFRMSISGKLMRTSIEKGDADVQFGPVEAEQQLSFLNGFLGKQPALVFASAARIAGRTAAETAAYTNRDQSEAVLVQPISEERQSATKYLRIGKPLRTPVVLQTGSMRAPLAALNTCIDDLLTTWGVDVEKHKNLTQPVKPLKSPGEWIVASDYPLQMLVAGQPALVSFRLSVGADGVPTACHIQATTRPKEFDDAVCKSVMRRARFSPAIDAEGMPLASYYQNSVYFRIP